MNLRRTAMTYLIGMVAGAIAAIGTSAPARAQTTGAATFNPLKAYVGTWVATNPNESTPFLVVKIEESNGKLTGTMSHFKIAGIRNGALNLIPLTDAETPVSDLVVANVDASLLFTWSGDPPFHGGRVAFVAQGTSVAYINIPISAEESKKIWADNWGLARLSPTIRMRREPEAGNENQDASSPEGMSPADWKITTPAELINEAEFQYRFAHGIYADYATLLHSGQLTKTGGRFTVMPMNLQSEDDPLPGYLLRLLVSPDGSSYRLSIHEKASTDCGSGFFSDETGVIFKGHTAECPAN